MQKLFCVSLIFSLLFSYHCSKSTEPIQEKTKGIYFSFINDLNNKLGNVHTHFFVDFKRQLDGKYLLKDNNPHISQNSTLLNQNFPNPFEFTTLIRGRIPEYSEVLVEIFSYRESSAIRTFTYSSNQFSTYFDFIWDGKNDYYESLTSNLYNYKMTTEDTVIERSMYFNKSDVELLEDVNCIPFRSSNSEGNIYISYPELPIGEKIVWTDVLGNQYNETQIPDTLNFVFVREGYHSTQKELIIDTLRTYEYTISLKLKTP